MNMSNIYTWRCPRGHVMGLVTRDGRGVRRLLLYREAISYQPSDINHENLDVIAVIEGYVSDVKCSICGAIRTWIPGEEAIKILLKRINIVDQSDTRLHR